MPEIEVRLRAVLRHVDLTVLVRAHGSRIHVDIRIQLLCSHLEPPGLEQPAEGGCRDSLAETGHNTAGHKNVFSHDHPSSSSLLYYSLVIRSMARIVFSLLPKAVSLK